MYYQSNYGFDKKDKKMNSQAIYELAEKLTPKEISDYILKLEMITGKTSVDKANKESLRLYKSLIRLGDSEELACASVMLHVPISEESLENQRFAYEN